MILHPDSGGLQSKQGAVREAWSDAARQAAAAGRRSGKRGGGLYQRVQNARKAYAVAGGQRTGVVNRTAKRFPEHADYIKKHSLRFERNAGISKDYFKDPKGNIHVLDIKSKTFTAARVRGPVAKRGGFKAPPPIYD